MSERSERGQDAAFNEIAAGLEFPEGPVAMPDGSVVVAEMFGERVARIHHDGSTDVVCEVKGGPNGLAVGPDGALYLCNNGGCFTPVDLDGLRVPGAFDLERYSGGLIQRIDHDGSVRNLYTNCAGRPLRAPNDLVMDGHGGFYFTDFGITDLSTRSADIGAIYYALCDGSEISEVAYPVSSPNGIALGPDGTSLYYAETYTGRVFRRRIVEPGVLEPLRTRHDPAALLCGLPGMQLLDSLAVDGDGWVVVGTLVAGAITAIAPDGASIDQISTGDPLTTNICFGGPDMCTAYVTLSATGRLVSMEWPRRGLRLAHQ
jgi:gluconolactonase